MSLSDQLQDDLKTAMKSGDTVARQCIRMVLAALKNRSIELGEAPSEAQVLEVVAKEVKKRQDSAEQYDAAARPELAEVERAEIQVLERYLPQQLGEDATREIVRAAIAESGAASKKDMGLVMKAVMASHKGEVDGKLVQRLAGELLA